MKYSYGEYVVMFKALSDETRLKIISLLVENNDLCACNILKNFNITQPTLSYHMKILTDSGIVFAEKQGSWMHYKLNKDKIEGIKEFLGDI